VSSELGFGGGRKRGGRKIVWIMTDIFSGWIVVLSVYIIKVIYNMVVTFVNIGIMI